MGALVSTGVGLGQQNANNPGVDFGGFHNILSDMDPLGNKITQLGGDPLNLYGNKNNPNALLFPTQNQNANGIPSVLPSLGAQSMIPQAPQGGFMPLGQTNPMGGQTPGMFNQMAAQSAGQLFSPSSQFNPQVNPQVLSNGSKGALNAPVNNIGGTPYSSIALPGGGGNPALGSPSGSALSRSQIRGGNVGPSGVTEPSDLALSQLHNGLMAALKAQSGNKNPLISLNNRYGGY